MRACFFWSMRAWAQLYPRHTSAAVRDHGWMYMNDWLHLDVHLRGICMRGEQELSISWQIEHIDFGLCRIFRVEYSVLSSSLVIGYVVHERASAQKCVNARIRECLRTCACVKRVCVR